MQIQHQAPIRNQWWATDSHSWLGCEALSGKPFDTGAHRQWPRGVGPGTSIVAGLRGGIPVALAGSPSIRSSLASRTTVLTCLFYDRELCTGISFAAQVMCRELRRSTTVATHEQLLFSRGPSLNSHCQRAGDNHVTPPPMLAYGQHYSRWYAVCGVLTAGCTHEGRCTGRCLLVTPADSTQIATDVLAR